MLAEQLLLLALDPDKGRPRLEREDALEVGSCGALVSELALRKVVAVTQGRAVVVDARPPATTSSTTWSVSWLRTGGTGAP